MTHPSDNTWAPDPQLLGAYFDGELDSRDEVADLRARIEAWLEDHPEAAQEWQAQQRLRELWDDTAPIEPSAETWDQTLDAIATKSREAKAAPARASAWVPLGIVAAGIVMAFGLAWAAWHLTQRPIKSEAAPRAEAPKASPREAPNREDEVFPVATSEEIVIRRIEGADTDVLVVGRPPVDGPMELAAVEDIRVIRTQSTPNNQRPPAVRTGSQRPMIVAE